MKKPKNIMGLPTSFDGGTFKYVCDTACQMKIPWSFDVNGTSADLPILISDADVMDATAQFTNDAPIYCGGEAKKGNLAECYEYDYRSNR